MPRGQEEIKTTNGDALSELAWANAKGSCRAGFYVTVFFRRFRDLAFAFFFGTIDLF
jgi:hypothetical protein